MSERPTVRIRLRFDMESGEYDLIVDDSAPDMPEDYHDEVARRIANFLTHNPQIEDAGLRHIVWGEETLTPESVRQTTPQDEREEITD